MNVAPSPSTLWKERYETLRRHFLENRPLLGAEPLGLSLLLHNGMAGWMCAWQRAAAAKPQPTTSCSEPWDPPALPGSQEQLTRLIAHMTAQHLQPSQPL